MDIIRNKLADRMYEKYSYLIDQNESYDLAEDICTACNEKKEFMVLLKEWMNGKTMHFHDYFLNGFSLVDLACRLDEKNPNIPVAILIFYVEENFDSEYRTLAVVADTICLCDYRLLKGERCKIAWKHNGIWYFLNNDEEEYLRECQMWQVLLLNPRLIIQMTYEYPDETSIELQEDGSYLIRMMEEDRKE